MPNGPGMADHLSVLVEVKAALADAFVLMISLNMDGTKIETIARTPPTDRATMPAMLNLEARAFTSAIRSINYKVWASTEYQAKHTN